MEGTKLEGAGSLAVLKLSMVTPDDSGEYTVVAENAFGKVESAARIEVYPLSAPEDRAKEQQLRQQQQYLQQQLRYEKALEREQIERKAREEENLLIREEQERLRRLFERERAERERLEQIRRREAEERERLLRQHRLDEQDRLRRIEEEKRLRQLQWSQPYQLQYPPQQQQQQQQYWNQDPYSRNAQQYVPSSTQEVLYDQQTFVQQHPPQPAPRHFQEYHRSVPSDNQFRQFTQYQKHIESQRIQNMPALKPTPGTQTSSGPMANGESAVSATRTKVIPGHSHEHGASLVPTTGVPPPTLEWCLVDGTPIKDGGKFKIEHGSAGDSKLIIEKVDANDANTYAAIARNSGGTFQSRFMLNVLQARPPDAPEFTGKFQSTTIYEGDSGRVVVQSRQKLGPAHREQVTLRKVDRRMARTPVPVNEMQDRAASKSAPVFSSKPQTLNLIEGQTARLEFKYSPADDPNIKIVWLLNGKPLTLSSRVTTINEKGLSILEINPVTVFDQGEYTVVLVNPLGEARNSVVLNVMGNKPQTLNLIEGQTARLEFKYSPADDPNMKIVWLLNGKPITLSSRVTTINEKGLSILEINPVTVFDQGEYTVVLVNPLGEARNSVVLNVMDLPNFHSDLRSHELFEGQPIHLEAKLTPLNDPNLVVVWYLNGRELMKNDRCHQTLNHGFATLDILNSTKDDSGVFTCRAINKLGESENQATVIVHPRVDLHKYEHNRDLDVDDVREIQYSHAKQDMVPKFLTQLQPFHCDQELGRSFFEARISPVNDPSLRVSWLKDGHALPNANRIQTFNNFGVVSLSLNPTYPDDAGTYTCVLFNANGQAQSSAELTTIPMPTLQLDTKHQDSLQIIGYLDSHQEVDRPEEFQSLDKPKFVRPLAARIECMENDPVHFEARLQPANDVKMTVEWYHNGAPLPAAHRFRPMFDFGYVALDILYAYPEDSGTYTLVARNELGEAQCNLELVVGSAKTLYLDPHHPEGLQRIQELEQDRHMGLPEVEDRTCDAAPQIIGNLNDLELNEHDDIHVDVKGAIAEDSGDYSLRVSNALGEAIRQCKINVIPSKEVLLDTHHEESLDKINYLENLDKYGRREIEEHGPDMAPVLRKANRSIWNARSSRINDNTLKVTWLRNGAPIPHGHRFRTFYDFGFVSLDILGVYPQDSGEYTCKAENALGSVETKTKIDCKPKDAILGQVQHPKSYQRIQEIEAPKPKPQIIELQKAHKRQCLFSSLPSVPTFVKQLGPAIQCSEGDNIYLEAQVAPADDNTLTYEWLVNGRPLMKAHRFVLSQDFGYIALNILYCYPEDSGTYTLVVRNAAGEAQSTVDIDCRIDAANYRDSFHPTSLQRIKELETPLQRVEPAPEKPKEVPQILRGLPPKFDIVHESQTLHLEVQVTPVDDNTLKYQWLFNGQPLKASSRYRLLNDFGYITLDIDYVIAEDAGKYTLVIENEAGNDQLSAPEEGLIWVIPDVGRAETSCEFDVERLKSILADTAHPESLRRIQEIEQLQPAKPSEPELPPQPPVFTQKLTGPDEILKEGQSVHMDCVVQPINDPSLKIEWFCDGRPLMFGSRIRTIHDFGYVGLEFLHVHPEDTGTYVCRATNNVGQAETSLKLECKPRRNIYLDTQHESSWVKIQEMENRQEIRPPSPEMSFPPPTFTEQLQVGLESKPDPSSVIPPKSTVAFH
ncbi:immunoglobulin I-set domain protein [Ostertagia ostertagi]